MNKKESRLILDNVMNTCKIKTDRELAEYLGVGFNALKAWIQRDKIPDKFYNKIQNILLNNTNNNKNNNILQNNTNQRKINISSTQIQIPIFTNQAVSAGKGIVNFDDEFEVVVFNKLELKLMFKLTSVKDLGILRVIGNSMQPTINEGDMLVFQMDGTSYEGGIYVIEYDGELFVKRLFKRPVPMLKSDNKDYEPIMLNEDEEFRIIGRVVGTYRIEHKAL